MQLPTTLKPTYDGSNKKTTTNTREVKFGSNYTQRTADGINNVSETWELEWIGSVTDISELDNFFIARGGWDSFTWTPYEQTEELVFTCTEWTRTYSSDRVNILSAKLVQQFDLI